jgi:hypothetical protein
MKTAKIDVQCGIYDTEYTIRDYGKHIVITAPFIKWENNSGSLDFWKSKISNEISIKWIRQMVAEDTLCIDLDNGAFITIEDIATKVV